MVKVSLQKLLFHSYHGLYGEEKITGNDFEVNIDVSFEEQATVITSLQHTVNYGKIYEMVKKKMLQPEALLETLAMQIGHQIKEAYPYVTEINVSVSKIKPPLLNFQGQTCVSFHKVFAP